MTSQYATDAVETAMIKPRFAMVDADGVPIQGQIPGTSVTLTATGTVPASCPQLVILSAAAPITISTTSLRNLVGRTVTFASDGVNAIQHIITFPANSIGGAARTTTFNANAAASITFRFFKNGANFYAVPIGTYQVVIS